MKRRQYTKYFSAFDEKWAENDLPDENFRKKLYIKQFSAVRWQVFFKK